MPDTNQLPEPDLGYIKTDISNQPAFSARQMREAMTHTNKLPPLPTPKFTETIRGVPCITVTEHEHLMRAYALQARAILALRPERVPMTDDVVESAKRTPREIARSLKESGMACNCDLDRWEPEKATGHSRVCRIHKAAMSAFLGITAQAKKETS